MYGARRHGRRARSHASVEGAREAEPLVLVAFAVAVPIVLVVVAAAGGGVTVLALALAAMTVACVVLAVFLGRLMGTPEDDGADATRSEKR